MIIFPNTSSSLEVILSGTVATTALPIVANWVDILTTDQSVSAFGEIDTTVTGANAVSIVTAPIAGHTRTLKSLTIYNADSTGSTATVRYNNGTTTRIMVKILLGVGDTLEYVE